MTLGKLKIAILKLMFEGNGETLTEESLAGLYTDDNYKELLESMPETINRGIDRFVINGLLPNAHVETSKTDIIGENKEDAVHKVRYIDYDTPDSAILDIPQILIRMLAYFVKAELIEDDDMIKSNLARNIFENNLSEYIRKRPDLDKQCDEIQIIM